MSTAILSAILPAIVLILLVLIVKLLLGPTKTSSNKENWVAAKNKTELANITIYTHDGKELAHHTAKSETVDWDSQNGVFVEFETQDGKTLTYIVSGFLVKMENL